MKYNKNIIIVVSVSCGRDRGWLLLQQVKPIRHTGRWMIAVVADETTNPDDHRGGSTALVDVHSINSSN